MSIIVVDIASSLPQQRLRRECDATTAGDLGAGDVFYTGACGSLTQATCNDDAPLISQSQLTFAASGGTTYFFLVTAYSGNGGNLVFNLSFTP